MAAVLPLSAYRMADTGDAEELRASFANFYGRPVLQFTGRDRSFHAVVNHCKLQHIELNYGTYAGHLQFAFPESIFVSQVFPVRGSGEAVVEGQTVRVDRTNSVLVSGNVPLSIRSDVDYERLILCIRSASLSRTLTTLTGKDITAPVVVKPSQSLLSLPGRLLREQVMFLAAQLSSPYRLPAPALAEFEQTLMAMFLRTNRHSYSHLFEADAPCSSLEQVRSAEEYIAAHWNEPVTLDDLAAVSGASVLSLFRSFRMHRGYSPREFLQRVRSEHQRSVD